MAMIHITDIKRSLYINDDSQKHFVLESATKHDSGKAVYRITYFATTVSGGGLSDTLHMSKNVRYYG